MIGYAFGVIAFFVGSYHMGRYSVRRQLKENIVRIENFHRDAKFSTEDLDMLLEEHKDFLKNKI